MKEDPLLGVCLAAVGLLNTAHAVFWLAVGLGLVWLVWGP